MIEHAVSTPTIPIPLAGVRDVKAHQEHVDGRIKFHTYVG